MRPFRTIAVLTAALLLVAACGGGSSNKTLTKASAPGAVKPILLTEKDLGGKWKQTSSGTTTTVASDSSEDDPFTKCTAKDLDKETDAHKLAESDTRDFELAGDVIPSSLEVSTAAFDDTSVVDDVFQALSSTAFRKCLTSSFEDSFKADASGSTFSVGKVTYEDSFVDVGGVRAGHLGIPFTVKASGLTLDATVDVVFVARGQLASQMIAFGTAGGVSSKQLTRWSTLLADRQTDALS